MGIGIFGVFGVFVLSFVVWGWEFVIGIVIIWFLVMGVRGV